MDGHRGLAEAQIIQPPALAWFCRLMVQVNRLCTALSHPAMGREGLKPSLRPTCPAVCLGAGLPFCGWFSPRGILSKFARRCSLS